MVARLRPMSIIEIRFPWRGKRKSYYTFDCVIDRLIKQGFLNKGRKDGDLAIWVRVSLFVLWRILIGLEI